MTMIDTNYTNTTITTYTSSTSSDMTKVIISGFICAVSVLGNAVVVFIISRNKQMQTVTYKLILNLAMTDLFSSLICIPPEIPMFLNRGKWIYGLVFCKILYPLQTLSVYGTVFTLVTINLIRCWTIMCPLKRQLDGENILWFVCPIWGFSLAIVMPYVLVLNYNKEQSSCSETWSESHSSTYTLIIFFTQFLIPLMVICIAYFLFVNKLRSLAKKVVSSTQKRRQKEAAMITNMAIATTVNLAVCLLPFQALAILVNFWSVNISSEVHAFAYILLFCHSAINPILYNIFNRTFRNSFMNLAICICKS